MNAVARAHAMDKVIELMIGHPCYSDAVEFRSKFPDASSYSADDPQEEIFGVDELLNYLRLRRHQPGTALSIIKEIESRLPDEEDEEEEDEEEEDEEDDSPCRLVAPD